MRVINVKRLSFPPSLTSIVYSNATHTRNKKKNDLKKFPLAGDKHPRSALLRRLVMSTVDSGNVPAINQKRNASKNLINKRALNIEIK